MATTSRRRPSKAVAEVTPSRGLVLQSLQRGVSILEVLATSNVSLSTREMAERTGLDRTVTHRLLRTLEVEELVIQEGSKYSLGPRALVLGNNFLRHNALRQAAMPFLVDLLYRGFANQPWALSVVLRVGRQMTQVSQIWSPTAPLDTILSVSDFPIDQTAAGRCILAYLDPEATVALIGPARVAELEARFEEIRAAGGVDFVLPQERADAPIGLAALSALILARSGSPVAGLTLSGIELEPHLQRNSAVAVRLLRTAQEIGRRLA
jgi:IclR family transcriptional regulator, acetate operon repressor